jgi:hypothetical protein
VTDSRRLRRSGTLLQAFDISLAAAGAGLLATAVVAVRQLRRRR